MSPSIDSSLDLSTPASVASKHIFTTLVLMFSIVACLYVQI